MSLARPLGFGAASGLACAVGWTIAAAAGLERAETAVALLAAWLVQLVAFVPLARRLEAGRDATATWLGGIALRGGGVLAAWPLAAVGLVPRSGAIAFGLALAALIVMEAVWLATIPPQPGSKDERREC